MIKLEERIKDKLEEPRRRVSVFEAKNQIQFISHNVMSVVQFFSGPVNLTLGGLTRRQDDPPASDQTKDADEAMDGNKSPRHKVR